MKVILFMAMSVNGMIADEEGHEDFLSHDNWTAFAELANKIGSNIWGRKTYQSVKTWEGDYLKDLASVYKVVISTDQSLTLDPGFTLAVSPKDAIAKLEAAGKQETLLSGGPTLNSSFIKAGLVDEIVLTIEPVMLGKGVSIFSAEDFELRLKLLEIKNLTPDLLRLHYRVTK